MARYHTGRRGEWKVKQMLQREGYVVYRAAGSKGAADLVAIKNSQAYLIQVKRNHKPTKQELWRLYDEATLCGAFPIISLWDSRKRKVQFYHIEMRDDGLCLVRTSV